MATKLKAITKQTGSKQIKAQQKQHKQTYIKSKPQTKTTNTNTKHKKAYKQAIKANDNSKQQIINNKRNNNKHITQNTESKRE